MDRRPRTFTTTLGDIALVRAYYYCSSCGDGWCPRDQSLGFGDSSLSPGVTRMAGLVASAGSFLDGSKLLSELAGIFMGAKCVERTAKTPGAAIAVDEIACVEEKPNPSRTMYAGVDGTGIPMRPDEVAGRPGKQPDGSSKTREVKQCVVWQLAVGCGKIISGDLLPKLSFFQLPRRGARERDPGAGATGPRCETAICCRLRIQMQTCGYLLPVKETCISPKDGSELDKTRVPVEL